MPTITQLEYLLAVNLEKHFGRAANICGVSQPSLSNLIQKLEEELGVVIFDRSKKPILPTEVGLTIIKQAEKVLRENKKILSLALESGKVARGPFHLAVIPTLAPYLIPLFIKDFSEKYPKIELKISEYQTKEMIKLLTDDQLDAGVLVTPLREEQIIERHLFFEPFYVYLSPKHPLSERKLFSEDDLNAKDLWLLEEGHCFREQTLKVCKVNEGKVLPNVDFASGNLETLKNLVNKTQGFTILPELALANLTKSELEKSVKKFKRPIPTREVSLVHSRSFLKEKIIVAIEESILANLPKNIRSLKKDYLDVKNIE